ncbi:cytochrome c oxidase assembly factor 3, mitochondrial isoform X2 [Diachasmimorpha longicaudata]|uniref:cytochrome c oxidase assembly factor 3, mitochondrial isoform X2 n=1 Tax=Diachasmimorpha longicaudata TaxID=58733 RepID=UPI0030B87B69
MMNHGFLSESIRRVKLRFKNHVVGSVQDLQVMGDESMPKVDLVKDASKLSTSDLHWMKLIEKQNLERVQKLKLERKRSAIIGLALTAAVFSIYSYTIHAVKQENYFDDFELPETISDED